VLPNGVPGKLNYYQLWITFFEIYLLYTCIGPLLVSNEPMYIHCSSKYRSSSMNQFLFPHSGPIPNIWWRRNNIQGIIDFSLNSWGCWNAIPLDLSGNLFFTPPKRKYLNCDNFRSLNCLHGGSKNQLNMVDNNHHISGFLLLEVHSTHAEQHIFLEQSRAN